VCCRWRRVDGRVTPFNANALWQFNIDVFISNTAWMVEGVNSNTGWLPTAVSTNTQFNQYRVRSAHCLTHRVRAAHCLTWKAKPARIVTPSHTGQYWLCTCGAHMRCAHASERTNRVDQNSTSLNGTGQSRKGKVTHRLPLSLSLSLTHTHMHTHTCTHMHAHALARTCTDYTTHAACAHSTEVGRPHPYAVHRRSVRHSFSAHVL
jgi:hypothetical protein